MAAATARGKTIRVAPRKMRLVADLIRGKRVDDARAILMYTVKKSAPIVSKVLESAVANAENAAAERNERIDSDEMVITNIEVNEGPTIRRFRPAPRGRATRIRKRTCNIILVIGEK